MALTNSIGKTSFVPKSGPGQAGFTVKRVDKRIWTDIDGTRRPINTDFVKTTTADLTLTAVDSGATVIVNATATKTITLPAAAVGLRFTILLQAATVSGAGHTIVPAGTEKVFGKTITAAAGKGLINTQATAADFDLVKLFSDGTDWFAELVGTWARVA